MQLCPSALPQHWAATEHAIVLQFPPPNLVFRHIFSPMHRPNFLILFVPLLKTNNRMPCNCSPRRNQPPSSSHMLDHSMPEHTHTHIYTYQQQHTHPSRPHQPSLHQPSIPIQLPTTSCDSQTCPSQLSRPHTQPKQCALSHPHLPPSKTTARLYSQRCCSILPSVRTQYRPFAYSTSSRHPSSLRHSVTFQTSQSINHRRLPQMLCHLHTASGLQHEPLERDDAAPLNRTAPAPTQRTTGAASAERQASWAGDFAMTIGLVQRAGEIFTLVTSWNGWGARLD